MVSISYAAASDVDGLPPSSAPAAPRAEELLRAFDSIELDVDGSRGVGVLHVTTRRVVWITAERGDDGDAAEDGAAEGRRAAKGDGAKGDAAEGAAEVEAAEGLQCDEEDSRKDVCGGHSGGGRRGG